MSPTGATVLRDVLVASCADVVDAIDVPPVPRFWQIRNVEILVRTRGGPENRQVVTLIRWPQTNDDVVVVLIGFFWLVKPKDSPFIAGQLIKEK